MLPLPLPWKWRRRRLAHAAPPAIRLVQGLALLVMVGTLALMLPGVATSGRLSFNQAIFTATSAASVAGLSVITPAEDLTWLGQLVLMLLIQAGGVGFMMLAVFMMLALGRKISLADRLALQDSLGLNLPRAVVRIAGRTVLGVLAIEAMGALLLWWHWTPLLGTSKALWYGIFHAVSAFCNAGFDLWAGAPGHRGIPTDLTTLTILGALIVAGGLGIPVWGDLLFRRGRWSLHTRVTLVISAVLIFGGALAIAFSEHQAGGLLAGQPWSVGLGKALFQSIAARTAGFAALENSGATYLRQPVVDHLPDVHRYCAGVHGRRHHHRHSGHPGDRHVELHPRFAPGQGRHAQHLPGDSAAGAGRPDRVGDPGGHHDLAVAIDAGSHAGRRPLHDRLGLCHHGVEHRTHGSVQRLWPFDYHGDDVLGPAGRVDHCPGRGSSGPAAANHLSGRAFVAGVGVAALS